jgi:hypothetical protein
MYEKTECVKLALTHYTMLHEEYACLQAVTIKLGV